jgi:hypothetical protein
MRSHDAAQIVGIFWQWSGFGHDKMKQESAKHPESGGG